MDLNKDIEKKKIEIISQKSKYLDIEMLINSLLDDGKDYLYNNGGKYQTNVINEIINVENKAGDIMKHKNSDEKFELHDFNTFLDMAMIISVNYFNAVLDTENRLDKDEKKNKELIGRIFINTYHIYKKRGIVETIIGKNNIPVFEKHVANTTGISLLNDLSFVEKESYLITKLSKNKLISIGDIYSIRKTMLFSFKKEKNKKFFYFYYNNFSLIAEFIEINNKLDLLIPYIKLCLSFSKQGKYEESFIEYVKLCEFSLKICKNHGLNIDNILKNWNGEKNIINLPTPNNLFVKKAFNKSIIYSF
jgi:hypothetical protein